MKDLKGQKECFLNNQSRALRLSSGQALIELAVFATVFLMVLSLLVRYGLSLNYNQQIDQEAFRRGLRKSALGNPGGKYLQGVSLTLVEDRRMPTTQGPFGLDYRSEFISGANVTWSSNLNMSRAYDVNSPMLYEELPQTDYNIDGVAINMATGWGYFQLSKADGGPTIYVKVDDPPKDPDDPLSDSFPPYGVYYRWVAIDRPYNKFDKDKGGILYDLDGDGEKEVVSLADVPDPDPNKNVVAEADGKEESLFYETDKDGNLENIWFIDYQKGELDTTKNSSDEGDYQGLFNTWTGNAIRTFWFPKPRQYRKAPGDFRKFTASKQWVDGFGRPLMTRFGRRDDSIKYSAGASINSEELVFRTFKLNPVSYGSIIEDYRIFPLTTTGEGPEPPEVDIAVPTVSWQWWQTNGIGAIK